ncbi:hypothetical protein AKO1_006169 [Acrasis kona]|uniref:Uncharacterized protein n=1 Tax=Acrasis kona TaxID=1008807 RepID=A0AAW2YH39_9EUKA
MGQKQATPKAEAPLTPFKPLVMYSENPEFIIALLESESRGPRADDNVYRSAVHFTAKVIDMGRHPLQICQHLIAQVHHSSRRNIILARAYILHKKYNEKQSFKILSNVKDYSLALDIIFESFIKSKRLHFQRSAFSDVNFIFCANSIPNDEITTKDPMEIPTEIKMVLAAVDFAFKNSKDQNNILLMKKITLLLLYCPEGMSGHVLDCYESLANALLDSVPLNVIFRSDDHITGAYDFMERLSENTTYNEYLIECSHRDYYTDDYVFTLSKDPHPNLTDKKLNCELTKYCKRRKEMMLRSTLHPTIREFLQGIPQCKSTKSYPMM